MAITSTVYGASGELVFLVGAGVQLLVSAIVESAICALYVCYAEDPNALAMVHPQLYASFVHANPTVPLPNAPIFQPTRSGRADV
ncbi:hypothetical protein T492DRAFT_884015 [Pavlovales sp. CCMP2436]|nr:hypothetical protein T492DRAFT_884015 [Pavlovales sp. CCMP2436]